MVRLTEKILRDEAKADKASVERLFEKIKVEAVKRFILTDDDKNIINLFNCIFHEWKEQINERISENEPRLYNFLFDDLVRGKCYFYNQQ